MELTRVAGFVILLFAPVLSSAGVVRFEQIVQNELQKPLEDNGVHWAVLVAGSSGYYNYRHQVVIFFLFSSFIVIPAGNADVSQNILSRIQAMIWIWSLLFDPDLRPLPHGERKSESLDYIIHVQRTVAVVSIKSCAEYDP